MQEDDCPIDPCPYPTPHLPLGRDDPLTLCQSQGLILWPAAEDLSLWWSSLGAKSPRAGLPIRLVAWGCLMPMETSPGGPLHLVSVLGAPLQSAERSSYT